MSTAVKTAQLVVEKDRGLAVFDVKTGELLYISEGWHPAYLAAILRHCRYMNSHPIHGAGKIYLPWESD